MKNCSKCKQLKDFDSFSKDASTKSGFRSQCKVCAYATSKIWVSKNRAKKYSSNNKTKTKYKDKYKVRYAEKIKARKKAWGIKNAEYVSFYNRFYYNLDQNKHRERTKLYRLNNPEYTKEYSKKNRGILRAAYSRYRSAKLQATPKWLTDAQLKELQDVYINCPEGYEVDHIVPLRGRSVRGLHVPWNLQYLTSKENKIKNNKFPVQQPQQQALAA